MQHRRIPLYLLIAAAFPAWAQQKEAAPERKLGEVVVTAKGADDANAVLKRDDLAVGRARMSDTAALLEELPGLSIYGAGGVSSLPAIHGLADDRIRIKVDGMDLISSCPNHMNAPLSYVDPTNIGALKVYAGITPVSVGGDSIGGTIVVETPLPAFAKPGQGSLVQGEAGAFYRSNGNAKGANVSATYATESLSLNYAGSTAESGNYKAGGDFKWRTDTGRTGQVLPKDEVGTSAFKTRNQTISVALKGGDHFLELKLGYQDVPYQLYPNQRMDMLGNTQTRLNLRYIGQRAWGMIEGRIYDERVGHYMNFGADKQYAYGNGAFNGMPMNTESTNVGGAIKATIDLTESTVLRIGGEYQNYKLNDWWPPSGTGGMSPGNFWNVSDGRRERKALFGEWESRLDAQWLALLGARYEEVSMDAGNVRNYNTATAARQNEADAFNASNRKKSDGNLDLTALARYTVDATQDIEFGFARKVRSPNVYERYAWSTWQMAAAMINYVGDGNGYVGDVNLRPEKAHTLSATFDWHAKEREWEFKATPYYTRVTDFIDATAVGVTAANANPWRIGNFNVLRFNNQTARLYGADLSGRMPLARTGWGDLGMKGVMSYVNGKNLDTGSGLYNIMPLNARITLTQKLGAWDNAVEVVAVRRKDDVSSIRNEVTTPGYGIVNLRASYAWQQMRVDFGIENLFDRLYAKPLGGTYVGQGTTMSLNTTNMPWGIAVPGMGRSLYTAFNVKF